MQEVGMKERVIPYVISKDLFVNYKAFSTIENISEICLVLMLNRIDDRT